MEYSNLGSWWPAMVMVVPCGVVEGLEEYVDLGLAKETEEKTKGGI
jgi:hypothetical protein